jgi:hypothetical protein
MGIHRGSNIIRSGLEFAFDTGYSSTFNNKSRYLYNQGEPTTNYITANLETLGTDGSGQSSVGTRTTIAPNHVKIVDVASNTRQSYLISGLTGGTTYTVSIEFKKLDGSPTFRYQLQDYSGSSYLRTIKFTDANAVRIWLQDGADYTTSTHSFELRNPQLEAKGHATPYVSGSRSNTASLLDITGQRNINVSNASFDSDAHIDLDGTGDYLSLGSDITFKTNGASGGWTVESVVKYDSVAGGYNNNTSPANFIGSSGISYNSWYWSVLNSKLALWNISPGVWKYGSTTLSADTWYHTVLTCFGDGSSYQMYLNGAAEGGDHVSYSWNASYSGLKVQYFGAGQTNRRYVNGKIPITRIYNRALSAQEVKQNFNAYKDRFNM